MKRFTLWIAAVTVAILLAACGGGGDSGPAPTATTTPAPLTAAQAMQKVQDVDLPTLFNKGAQSAEGTEVEALVRRVPLAMAAQAALPKDQYQGLDPSLFVAKFFPFAETAVPEAFPAASASPLIQHPVYRCLDLKAYNNQWGLWFLLTATNVERCANTALSDLPEGAVYVIKHTNELIRLADITVYIQPSTLMPPAWWSPATRVAVGTRVTSWGFLSLASSTVGDSTFLASAQNGTIRVQADDQVIAGLSPKPIMWATFQRSSVSWCVAIVHTDGTPVPGYEHVASICSSEAIDYTVVPSNRANGEGIIRHSANRNACFQLRWNNGLRAFESPQVPCPQ